MKLDFDTKDTRIAEFLRIKVCVFLYSQQEKKNVQELEKKIVQQQEDTGDMFEKTECQMENSGDQGEEVEYEYVRQEKVCFISKAFG